MALNLSSTITYHHIYMKYKHHLAIYIVIPTTKRHIPTISRGTLALRPRGLNHSPPRRGSRVGRGCLGVRQPWVMMARLVVDLCSFMAMVTRFQKTPQVQAPSRCDDPRLEPYKRRPKCDI